MAWALVIVAGVFETIFAVCLKLSDGFSRLGPTLGFLGASIISFTLLSIGLRSLPVGSAYAAWTGIGAVGTAVFGILFLERGEVVRRRREGHVRVCGDGAIGHGMQP